MIKGRQCRHDQPIFSNIFWWFTKEKDFLLLLLPAESSVDDDDFVFQSRFVSFLGLDLFFGMWSKKWRKKRRKKNHHCIFEWFFLIHFSVFPRETNIYIFFSSLFVFRFRFNPSTAGVTHTHQTHSPHALVEKKNSFFHFFFIFRPLGSRRKEQTLGPRSLKHHSSNQQWRPFLFLVCVSFSLHKLVVFPWLKLIRNSKTFLSLSDFTHVDDLKFTFSDAKTLEVRWRASASTGKKNTHTTNHTKLFLLRGENGTGEQRGAPAPLTSDWKLKGVLAKPGRTKQVAPFSLSLPPLSPQARSKELFQNGREPLLSVRRQIQSNPLVAYGQSCPSM